MNRIRALFAVLLVTLVGVVPVQQSASAGPPPTTTHTVTYDQYSFMIDSKRVYLWAGEFHYYRLPSPDLWRDVLEKLKARPAGAEAENGQDTLAKAETKGRA